MCANCIDKVKTSKDELLRAMIALCGLSAMYIVGALKSNSNGKVLDFSNVHEVTEAPAFSPSPAILPGFEL